MTDQEKLQRIARTTKGAAASLRGLREVVLDPRSIPCPHCVTPDDEPGCIECLNIGWIIPEETA